MADIYSVNVLDACDKILVEATSFSLPQSLLRDNVVKKLASMAILHYHIVLCFCFNDLIVNMLTSYNLAMLGWFTSERILISLWILSTSFFSLILDFSKIFTATYFESTYLFSCVNMNCFSYFSKCSFAQCISKNVVTNVLSSLLLRGDVFIPTLRSSGVRLWRIQTK